ncbi:ROK family transcriptional regulator [Occultella kanbiaonis]|uniref:ROK family transcriptional regulator n=1 Tax=Occultella kanbiaonis TaxID=2675754 RepID=UPI0013D30459|nr:ROK family transcriptional regulator [Occultella kanbiaonis]
MVTRTSPSSAAGRSTGGDQSLLRRINLSAALARFRAGPATVAQIGDTVGVSRTSAQQIVNQLLELRWIAPEKSAASATPQIGPAPRRHRFRAEAGYVAGVDLGRHRVRAVVADLGGDPLSTSTVEITPDADSVERLQAARTVLEDCCRQARIRYSQVWVVAAGARGVIHAGTVVAAGGMPGWTGIDLETELRDRLERHVVVGNDCNIATVGEHWRGAGQDAASLVNVAVGQSIGAGIMIDGRLLTGFGGFAGELHHLPFLRWRGAAARLKADPGEEVDIKSVFDDARDGSETARKRVEDYTRALAEGVAALVATIDPELVVIGGGLSASGDTLLEPLRRHLEPLTARMPRLEVSPLGPDAVTLGAVRIALNHVDTLIDAAADRLDEFPKPLRRVIATG